MKKNENIIKRINLTKKYKFNNRKSYKHYFKVVNLKYKFFNKVSFYWRSFYYLSRLVKYYKYNILNISRCFIVNRYNYFNYISNGLDLKYNNLYQSLNNLDFIYQFDKKRSIFLKSPDLSVLKYQKFISFLDDNYIYNDYFDINSYDLFNSPYYLYCIILYNTYILCFLLLIKNIFKKLQT